MARKARCGKKLCPLGGARAVICFRRLLTLLIASSAPAICVARTPIGNPGNAAIRSRMAASAPCVRLQHRHLPGHERAVRRVPEREGRE
jgi:hypothetical protein